MPTTIRLQRVGRKAQGSFRIVVSDRAESRDGPAIETIGTYNPRTQPSAVRLDAAAALSWLHDGAQPTNTVISIFRKAGVWQRFQAGETAESLEETVVTLGPEAGTGKTSFRAEKAAKAWAERAVELKAEKETAAAATRAAAKAEAKAAAEAAESQAALAVEPEAEAEAAAEGSSEVAPEAEAAPEAEIAENAGAAESATDEEEAEDR